MSIKDLGEMRRIKGGVVGWSGHFFSSASLWNV
jgi:hypothetical protein